MPATPSHGTMPGMPVNSDAFKAAVRRMDEQLEHVRRNASALEERSQEYEVLRGLLKELPEKVAHPIMVPLGPLAFFPGQVVHTNEVLTQLSSEWFALRTSKQALGMVDRRLKRINNEKQGVGKELKQISLRRRLAAGEHEVAASSEEAGVTSVPDVPGATVRVDEDGFMDIREPLEVEGDLHADTLDTGFREALTASSCPSTSSGAKAAVSAEKEKDTLARLRELEQLEEEQEESGAFGGSNGEIAECDELSELDRIMDLYQAAEPAEPVESAPRKSSGQEPQPAVCSPADLFRLMSQAEEPAEDAKEKIQQGLATTVAAGLSGVIRERVAGQDAGMFQPPLRAGTGEPEEAPGAQAPKRVSKFKADRQKGQSAG